MSAVVFDNVDIVFGDKQAEALAMVDRGATRDEILKSTGVVLGAAGVNLSIEPSEICVLMGLLRIRQVDNPARGQRPQQSRARQGSGP